MGWLGLDDTDSLRGGCTTQVFHDLIEHLPSNVECGVPRLVRLWPFAKRRTRGNAALSIEIISEDETELMRVLESFWNERILPLKGDVLESDISPREQAPTSPGMVWFDQQPDADIYWAAVRGNVGLEDLPEATRSWGGHGRIGATAAVAWPAENVTWEAIAWRTYDAAGQRRIDEAMLSQIDEWEDIVFSRDPRRGTGLIAPRGHSPVLFGIRSLTKASAELACQTLLASEETEQHDGWRVFCTNQASGDHLQGNHRGRVTATALNTARKHVVISTETFSMISYAEGGPVNALARWLAVGDEIEARGLVHPDGSLHVEQLRVLNAVPRKQRRPLCQTCGVRMKSMGSMQGLRCPTCKQRADDTWVDVSASPPFDGWTEPPVDARRHLARPLAWSEFCE